MAPDGNAVRFSVLFCDIRTPLRGSRGWDSLKMITEGAGSYRLFLCFLEILGVLVLTADIQCSGLGPAVLRLEMPLAGIV